MLTLVAGRRACLIWRAPLARWFGGAVRLVAPAMLLIALGGGHPDRALAFADTTDKTEAYTILPNESAFFIPDTGANKEARRSSIPKPISRTRRSRSNAS